MLHARRLALAHPLTNVALRFEAPMPPDMRRFAETRLALPPDRI
jgi:23S rRNA pseudouridine955/2504/2580 synthase